MYKTVYVPLLPDTSAFESLRRVEIDLLEDKWMDCYDKDCTVVILDDAQLRYTEGNFWKTFIKDLPVTCSHRISKVRFIIICTYLLSNAYNNSPVEFASLSRIEKEDLILTRDESFGLLTSNEIGLPSVLHSYSNLLEHMVSECAGHIGALRISVDYLAEQLKIAVSIPSEQMVLDWFFSKDLLLRMERCFGGLKMLGQRSSSEDVDTVIKLLAGQVCSCVDTLPPEIVHLHKCGVLRNRVELSEKVSSNTLLDDLVAPDEALSLEDNDTSLKRNNIPDKAAKDLAEYVTIGKRTLIAEKVVVDSEGEGHRTTNSLKDPAPSNPLPSSPPSPLPPPSVVSKLGQIKEFSIE